MSLALESCFQVPLSSVAKLEQSSAVGLTKHATYTSQSTTKAVATIDPESASSTQLAAPRVEGLSGASVIIAPGSLGIAVDIVVEQAADFGSTSLTSEIDLPADIQVASSSPGMIIRPSENADLKKPMALAMPLPSGFALRLVDASSKYAIFYKYFDPSELRLVTGYKIVDGVNVRLAFDEASGYDVMQFEGFFGAYWATTLSREVKASEVPPPKAAEEPIVNKANVSVIEIKGIVKESEIVIKQAIPELVWSKPSIKFMAETRSVSLSIPLPAGRRVSGCKVDLYENVNLPSGLTLDAPSGPSVEVPIEKASEHSLVGRFRCLDDQGLNAITPWSEVILIPALPKAIAVDNPMCASPQPEFEARASHEGGDDGEPFKALGACRYGADLFIDKALSFYFALGDSSLVCGFPTHSLSEGSQKLSCQKANASNLGSDFMSVARGNYRFEIDFSSSQFAPVLTITRTPCALSDMHVLIQDAAVPAGTKPVFPAPSLSSKMTHIGACEFVYEMAVPKTQTIDAKVTLVDAKQALFCGRIDGTSAQTGVAAANVSTSPDGVVLGPYWTPGDLEYGPHQNICSSTPKYFKMPALEAGDLSYRFSLRLGASAKDYGPDIQDMLSFERISNCPHDLYLYSNQAGQLPLRDRNESHKVGACKYEFLYAADQAPSDLAFQIGNASKSLLCGAVTSTPSDTGALTCSASALPIKQLAPLPGHIYRVVVEGNGLTGLMTSFAIEEIPETQRSCDGGLYMSASIDKGYYNDPALSFAEVSECRFEKVWIPIAANDGFYLHSGRHDKFCGSNHSSDVQPSIGGADVLSYCRGAVMDALDVGSIRPLNAVPGKAYKIIADLRFPYQSRVKIEEFKDLSCADNVFISSANLNPSTAKMAYRGDCSYSYDLELDLPPGTTLPYRFVIGGTDCALGAGLPADAGLERSVRLSCPGPDVLSLTTLEIGGMGPVSAMTVNTGSTNVGSTSLGSSGSRKSIYRIYLKRNPTDLAAVTTRQNITRFVPRYYLAGPAGEEAFFPPFSTPATGNPSASWGVDAYPSFLLKQELHGRDSYCGLAPDAELPNSIGPVPMICNMGLAASGQARLFENGWIAGDYLNIEIINPLSLEGRSMITVTPATP